MKFTHKKLVLAMTAVAAVGLAGAAHAEYPEEDITYIIPFDPGGESDVTARFQEPILEEVLGVSVNVTHRPGGGGAVAWSEFQNSAEPDGYEIIGVNIPHIIGQPIQRNNAGYETDNWRIVTFFHSTPNALIVHNDSPYDTLEDLVEDAKENPEAITLGGSGTYSANHLDMLRFEQEADIDLTYIPFSGTGPLKGALEGGHVAGIFNYTMLGTEMADSVKVLAVASEERVKALPDAPTFKEQGYDIVGGAYRGVAVPKGTPDEVVETLEEAFAEANRRIAEKQEPLGFVMEYITGEEVDEVIGMLREAYGPILEDAE
ncbi:tripartite tricarboxylate transporter substrate binding protein [Halomonas sp. M4R5S39]|uniref:Tripartite tricarboxylate transporter substrate binding protein n=1 Tax=Halomonas kalidii TaxID=3043293 RepID=A0ABT6VJ34_9GAMM|nr:tripartite tricarboxylate transporter substrate binding protein [Halomonas kalidii]MDI5933700.1 tripartite tricarboxylate transporter substrate binding protein [Halomonas kalidii]MDI5986904.1 tripartite tricarboxylate transporter substrate binding protein [Halomonas kalidii]